MLNKLIDSTRIPETHCDLIDGPYWAALTTVTPGGQPQTTPVWCNREGDNVLINSMASFRKTRNMRENPNVSLLVYDPHNPIHAIEIRGMVTDMTEDGALEHLDALTQLYMGKPDAHFYGDSIPAEMQASYVPLKITIEPARVRVEG